MATILVIEDNAAVRRVACKALQRAGHDTVEAEHGKAGVAAVRSMNPDLIVTDVFMPEQGGEETIRQIRGFAPRIPIIVISSVSTWGEDKPLDNARVVGADLALEKPFAIEDLVTAVNDLLAR